MSKVHVCDVCHDIIDNPYFGDMRTVKVWQYTYCFDGKSRLRNNLHLCRDCYYNMMSYLEKVKGEKTKQ